MSDSMLAPNWYRVAKIKLKLRSHVRSYRHVYRGRPWYILHDEASGKHHRYNEAAYRFISRIDGKRTVQQIWEQLCDQYGDEAPTQGEVVQMLGNLYFADCILGDLPIDIEDLIERRNKQRSKILRSKITNPVSIKIPLADPDRLLTRTKAWVSPLFTRTAFILMCLLMLAGLFETVRNWSSISSHVQDNALQPSNLLILLLVYPLVKGLHELGHAWAVKHWGGDVHEIGVMLLVFMPVPYVDASASTSFSNKYRRMAVAAAGIIVELVLASLALLLWLNTGSGLFSDILFNIMLIGGVSTLLFNGNPLLRFDGYYVLADAIEIPGLGNRANKYLLYLVQRYLLSSDNASSPVTAVNEHRWFIGYGIAAFLYRIFIMLTIVLFIASKYFFIGVALALWIIIKQALIPLFKGVSFVISSPSLTSNRQRAVTASMLLVSAFALLLFSVPLPLSTVAEGVVWMPEKSYVRAGSDGFVVSVQAGNGNLVSDEQPLIITEDVTLADELIVSQSQLSESESRYDSARQEDLVEAEIIKEDIHINRSKVERMQERLLELVMQSPVDGTFILPASQSLQGQYVKQGDALAYVIDFEDLSVRVAVPQDAIGLVRKQTEAVELRMVGALDQVYPSSVIREIPAATYRLPSRVLGRSGGGSIATDPFDDQGLRTSEKYFQFDVSLPRRDASTFIGQRVYVKFSHGYESLAWQWYRTLSELFLNELGKI